VSEIKLVFWSAPSADPKLSADLERCAD